MEETICWSGFRAERVAPESSEGARFATMTRTAAEDGAECARISIPLRAMAAALEDDAQLSSVAGGEALFGSLDPWLYRPMPWPRGVRARLEVFAPPSVVVSLPFPREPGGAYVVSPTAWSLMARAAIGKLGVDEVDVPGGRVTIARLPRAAERASSAGLRRFVDGAARAVSSLDGRLPASSVQILLLPSAASRHGDPVRFGMAMHGGGAGVMLLVDGAATDSSLFGEWVAVHELSHLWLPALDNRDRPWLPEGLASYYQCILRSRVGMYSEATGWDELVSGFERGRAQAASRGSPSLGATGRPFFQHYYWGGAAIMLKLDVLLRRSGTSLDAVVAAVRRGLPFDEDIESGELIQRFSRAAGRDLRADVDAWSRASFPDTSAELRDLGVVRRGDTVALDDRAPGAAIRRAIAAPR